MTLDSIEQDFERLQHQWAWKDNFERGQIMRKLRERGDCADALGSPEGALMAEKIRKLANFIEGSLGRG